MDGFANVSFTIELSPAWIVGILGSIVSLIVLLRLVEKARREPRFGGHLLACLFIVLLLTAGMLVDLGCIDWAGPVPAFGYIACMAVTAAWSIGLMTWSEIAPEEWKRLEREGIICSLFGIFCFCLIPAVCNPWMAENMAVTMHLLIWMAIIGTIASAVGLVSNVIMKA